MEAGVSEPYVGEPAPRAEAAAAALDGEEEKEPRQQ